MLGTDYTGLHRVGNPFPGAHRSRGPRYGTPTGISSPPVEQVLVRESSGFLRTASQSQRRISALGSGIPPGRSRCFLVAHGPERPKPLQSFVAEHASVSEATQGYLQVLDEATRAFDGLKPKPQLLQPSIDLVRVGAGSVAQERSYSEWLPHLTDAQRHILGNAVTDPLKIRGVAGSGKTLTLELKALPSCTQPLTRRLARRAHLAIKCCHAFCSSPTVGPWRNRLKKHSSALTSGVSLPESMSCRSSI